METLLTRYAFLRLFGSCLLIFAAWNAYLIRLLNDWSVLDLVHIGLGIGGCFVLGGIVLWRGRGLSLSSGPKCHARFEQVNQTLNGLLLLVLIPLSLGDLMTVSSFVIVWLSIDEKTVSEAACVARDTAIARLFLFFAVAAYFGLGYYKARSRNGVSKIQE
jgi:hypothetical protein